MYKAKDNLQTLYSEIAAVESQLDSMQNVAFSMLRKAYQEEFPNITDVQFESVILPAMTLQRQGGEKALNQGIGNYGTSHRLKFVSIGCEYLIDAVFSRKSKNIGAASKSLMMAFYSLGVVHGGGHLDEMRDIVIQSENDRVMAERKTLARKGANAKDEKKYAPVRNFVRLQALELKPANGWPNVRVRARTVFSAAKKQFPQTLAEERGINTVAQWLSDMPLN